MKFNYQLTFVLAIAASVAIVLTVLTILILALGGQALLVLGIAFALFISGLLVRDAVRARTQTRSL